MNSNKINLANLKAKTQAASERKLQKAPPGTVPSGKYKGRTVEALKADANYVSWLLRNDWFQKKHPDLYAQIGPASVPDVRTQLSKAYAEIAALTGTELDEILHDPALNAAYKQHRDYWSYVQSVLDSFDADPYGTTWLLGTCAAAQQLLKFSSGGRASNVKLPVLKGGNLTMSKFTIANLKVKYAAISTGTWNSKQKLTTTKSGQQIRPPSPKEGSFTETERAILLRSVIDAVHSKGVPFKIWHKHGLSRIYFADNSWLSYSPQGVCIFGPDKSRTAYQIRSELGLKKPAIRSVVL